MHVSYKQLCQHIIRQSLQVPTHRQNTVCTSSSTYSTAGGQKVDYIVVKLCHVIAHVQLCVFIPRSRVVLPYMHPKNGAHDPYDKAVRSQK